MDSTLTDTPDEDDIREAVLDHLSRHVLLPLHLGRVIQFGGIDASLADVQAALANYRASVEAQRKRDFRLKLGVMVPWFLLMIVTCGLLPDKTLSWQFAVWASVSLLGTLLLGLWFAHRWQRVPPAHSAEIVIDWFTAAICRKPDLLPFFEGGFYEDVFEAEEERFASEARET